MKLEHLIKIVFSLVLIGSNISCDQISKEKVRKEIKTNEIINVVGDNFILTKVENTGAALSLGQNLSPILKLVFLQIVPLIVLVFMFFYIIGNKKIIKLNLIGFSFIIGGGIGNIYDRIAFSSVTDFMYIEYGYFHTGVFNMADVSVVIGTFFVIFNSIQSEVKERFRIRES